MGFWGGRWRPAAAPRQGRSLDGSGGDFPAPPFDNPPEPSQHPLTKRGSPAFPCSRSAPKCDRYPHCNPVINPVASSQASLSRVDSTPAAPSRISS
jgi:hypothetical protein